MRTYAAAATVHAVAKGGSMMQALNIIAPITIVAVAGGALYLLQRWWRRRKPHARPEADSGGWTSQHTGK